MAFMHLSSVLDPQQNGGVDFGATMPSYDQQDALQALLSNYPTQQKPGFMQRLTAGLVGAGTGLQSGAGAGMDEVNKMLNQPYQNQIADWQNQTKVQQQLASDENQSNAMKRQLLGQELTNSQKNAALSEKDQHDQELAKTAQQNADTSAKRAQAAMLVAQGGHLEFSSDNKPMIVNRDGTTIPVDANVFSPQEMQGLKDQAAMQRVATAQAGANERTAETQAGANSRAQSKTAAGPHVSRIIQAPDGTTLAVMSDNSVVPMKDIPVGSTAVPAATSQTTTENKVITPPSFLGKVIHNAGVNFAGIGEPSVKDTTNTSTTTHGNPAQSDSSVIKMKAPDGTIKDIPKDQVDHFLKLGAVVVK